MAELMTEDLSDLIGAIYDCAVDPALWPATIGRICGVLRCVASQLYLFDRAAGRNIFASGWGEAPEATRRIVEDYAADAAALQSATLARWSGDMDDPMVLSRDVPVEFATSRATIEWARPLGYCDGITAVVLQDGSRIGFLAATRHDSVGLVTEREVALMRLIAPHVRRAVAIGSLLDMRALHAATLAATLDKVATPIGIVDSGGTVLHANAAAHEMFAAQGPARLLDGRLTARAPGATAALRGAIGRATEADGAIGRQGIGVPLGDPLDSPALAHVLPLARGEVRRGLVSEAAAAVFVTDAARRTVPDLAAVAAQFALTPAETRLLALLAGGAALADAAAALGIAGTTAKTHLARIFSKTGTTRQAELVALALQLARPG
ncbi:helix-turn-helix transcriptional regulator [Roseomonas rosulenta]|uniref:helix-turn-helix transcriptional regulator n=1 Tax=Roseomonas rosulenta TaxID=2748667 RepID=UPI0018DF3383|nr:LuxR C-terminal-related transcriptional regulator [Roseomonas rosulenta]